MESRFAGANAGIALEGGAVTMPSMRVTPGLGLSLLLVVALSACRPSGEQCTGADPGPTMAKPESAAADAGADGRSGARADAAADGAGAHKPALLGKNNGVAPSRNDAPRSVAAGVPGAADKASTSGTSAKQGSKRRPSGDWEKMMRAQLRRPTDFSKLTAELKRRQALSAGLDEAAINAELEKRALAGDAEAALTLGLLLRYGDRTTDKAQGEQLIASAAEAGNARAMAELGRLLLADETRADGAAEAESWLRKAWAAGESEGAYLLACSQRLGLLDPIEGENSTSLLLSAAEQGSEASRLLLSLQRKELGEADRTKLGLWLAETAETGSVPAMLQLAALKKEAGDYEGALGWLERAAANGSTSATMSIALASSLGPMRDEVRESAIAHLRVQLDDSTTASAQARYALATLLLLKPDVASGNRDEVLGLLRAAGENIRQAAVAAMLIDDGADPRAAMLTVLKMNDDEAYVRFVELRRARGDTTYSALADGMPKPVATVKPLYPAELKASGTTGDVTVRFLVGADGTVADCAVVQSDHPALSAAAVEAVKQWRFQPGVKNGKPVATQLQITLPFRLSQ
jgi:TonB family protein